MSNMEIRLIAKCNAEIKDMVSDDVYCVVNDKIYVFYLTKNILSDEIVYVPKCEDFICLAETKDVNDPYNIWKYFETIAESRKKKIKKILKDG